jgi:peroxiredoxin
MEMMTKADHEESHSEQLGLQQETLGLVSGNYRTRWSLLVQSMEMMTKADHEESHWETVGTSTRDFGFGEWEL